MIKRIIQTTLVLSIVCSSAAAQGKKSFEAVKEQPGVVEQKLPRVDITSLKKNKKGAYVLFDGTSLTGWRGYNKTHVPSKWSIEDGTLKFSRQPNIDKAEGGDLVFGYDFKNFELEFEWRISEAGNSGVFYLAKEIQGQPIYISAPEYQILDNEKHPDAKMGVDGNRKSASLYDMIPAKPQNSKPAGEWNKSKIVVKGNVIQHFQNNVKVVEYKVRNKAWTDLLQASKFSEQKWPIAFGLLNNVGGASQSGLIGFQDHGDDVWYKNITVKVLK